MVDKIGRRFRVEDSGLRFDFGKKGQQMTLGTIIAIVLGITVLVFLIWGFASGWNNMWDRVTNFGGGTSNVDTVVQGCALACSAGNQYDFCTKVRTVKFGEEKTLVVNDANLCVAGANTKAKSCEASCYVLSIMTTGDANIGVDKCPSISCLSQ